MAFTKVDYTDNYNGTNDREMYVASVKRGDKNSVVAAAEEILRFYGIKAKVVRTLPEWKPGDVVTVQFDGPFSRKYTYVRGQDRWPGELAAKTDVEINRYWEAGRAIPVLQQGGVPFDKSRLP